VENGLSQMLLKSIRRRSKGVRMKYQRNRDGSGPEGKGSGTGRGKGGC